MGNLKLWSRISRPLTNFRGTFDFRSVPGHKPSLSSETQGPSPYGCLGMGNYLKKKNFKKIFQASYEKNSGPFCQRHSCTVLIASSQGDVRPSQIILATRSPGNGGCYSPPNLGQNWAKVQTATKFQGGAGENFRGYSIEAS